MSFFANDRLSEATLHPACLRRAFNRFKDAPVSRIEIDVNTGGHRDVRCVWTGLDFIGSNWLFAFRRWKEEWVQSQCCNRHGDPISGSKSI